MTSEMVVQYHIVHIHPLTNRHVHVLHVLYIHVIECVACEFAVYVH